MTRDKERGSKLTHEEKQLQVGSTYLTKWTTKSFRISRTLYDQNKSRHRIYLLIGRDFFSVCEPMTESL